MPCWCVHLIKSLVKNLDNFFLNFASNAETIFYIFKSKTIKIFLYLYRYIHLLNKKAVLCLGALLIDRDGRTLMWPINSRYEFNSSLKRSCIICFRCLLSSTHLCAWLSVCVKYITLAHTHIHFVVNRWDTHTEKELCVASSCTHIAASQDE